MQRTFHARVKPTTWVLVAAIAAVALYFAWFKLVIPFVFALLLLVLIIERILHTKYTIDDKSLTISYGRFTKERVIDIDDIKKIERIDGLRLGGNALTHTLVITYSDNRSTDITPDDEQTFIQHIKKKRENAKK